MSGCQGSLFLRLGCRGSLRSSSATTCSFSTEKAGKTTVLSAPRDIRVLSLPRLVSSTELDKNVDMNENFCVS